MLSDRAIQLLAAMIILTVGLALRHFLVISGLLSLFYGRYDFRSVQVRFIVLDGNVYSYCFRDLR